MSADMSVLVRGCSSVDAVVSFCEDYFGLVTAPVKEDNSVTYKGRALGLSVSIFACDYENDQGIAFEDYPVMLNVYRHLHLGGNQYYDELFRTVPLMLASVFAEPYVSI